MIRPWRPEPRHRRNPRRWWVGGCRAHPQGRLWRRLRPARQSRGNRVFRAARCPGPTRVPFGWPRQHRAPIRAPLWQQRRPRHQRGLQRRHLQHQRLQLRRLQLRRLARPLLRYRLRHWGRPPVLRRRPRRLELLLLELKKSPRCFYIRGTANRPINRPVTGMTAIASPWRRVASIPCARAGARRPPPLSNSPTLIGPRALVSRDAVTRTAERLHWIE